VSVVGFPERNVLHLDGIIETLNLMARNGEMRFSELMNGLKKEKNPPLKNAAALSYRLRSLENSKLIKKRVENETGKPVKIFYYLTDDGREALTHLEKLNEIVHRANTR